MKFDWRQLAIAIALFLLGYFSFNSELFAQPSPSSQRATAAGAASPCHAGR